MHIFHDIYKCEGLTILSYNCPETKKLKHNESLRIQFEN